MEEFVKLTMLDDVLARRERNEMKALVCDKTKAYQDAWLNALYYSSIGDKEHEENEKARMMYLDREIYKLNNALYGSN